MGQEIKTNETYYDSVIRQGYDRRDFLKFVAFIGAYMGVESSALGQIATSLKTKPYLFRRSIGDLVMPLVVFH